MADVAGSRVHRDVLDERGLPNPRGRHRAAQPDATVELVHRLMGVKARDGADRQRPRVGRARLDDRIRGPSGKERDAAHLPRLVVERTGVAEQSHPCVDEPGQVLGRKVPEPGSHLSAFDGDVDKQRLARLRQPGPLPNTGHLDVLAVEDATEQRRVGDLLRAGQRRSADAADAFRHDRRGEPASGRPALHLDDVARVQVQPRLRGEIAATVVHEQPGDAVVDDDAGRLALVDVGDGAANDRAASPLGTLRCHRPDGSDVGQRRHAVLRAGGADSGTTDRARPHTQGRHRYPKRATARRSAADKGRGHGLPAGIAAHHSS